MLVANGTSVFDASESVSDKWCRKPLVAAAAAAAFCHGHLCPPSVTPHNYTHHQLYMSIIMICVCSRRKRSYYNSTPVCFARSGGSMSP